MRLHHYGIATDDIQQTIEYMRRFFHLENISPVIYDANQDASLCMLKLADNTKIELISGEITKTLVRKKQYLYHVCYETENFDRTVEEFAANQGILLSEPKEAVLFDNRKVAFIFTKLGIIELLEQ